MTTSPFGAVKDVTILSALVGNVVALVLMAIMWPRIGTLDLGTAGKMIAASVVVIVIISLLAVALGNRLFSLSRRELWWASALHLVRIVGMTGLLALIWNLYAPHTGLSVWAMLAVAQLVVSRLPLFVDSDVIFANIVIWFLGKGSEVPQVVAVVTILIMLLNLAAAVLLAVGDLVTVNRAMEKQTDTA